VRVAADRDVPTCARRCWCQRESRRDHADDGAALVAMMKAVLDAHSIHTLSADDTGEAISMTRVRCSVKLGRIIEARAVPVTDAAD
jgi:hypothetical protein